MFRGNKVELPSKSAPFIIVVESPFCRCPHVDYRGRDEGVGQRQGGLHRCISGAQNEMQVLSQQHISRTRPFIPFGSKEAMMPTWVVSR